MAFAIGNPQSTIRNPDDFVPIDEASELTTLSVRVWRRRAIKEAATGSLAYRAAPRTGKGRPVWWVHRSLDPRLASCPTRCTRDELARASLLERFPAHHVELAYRKYHWLMAWRRLCNERDGRTTRDLAAHIVAEAKRVEGDDFSISVRSLQLWWRAYNELGDDGRIRGIEALVPRYSNPQSATPDQPSRSPEAVDYFYGLYYSPANHSIKVCHEATARKAATGGWSWPDGYTATVRWLATRDKLDETCLYRDGRKAYSNRFLPHIEIDWTTISPGEFYVCDHTQVDFWCLFGGEQIRAWLTSILDCRSRCVVGWHFGDAPHQDAILAAMRMAFRDWAIPCRIRIDRGNDFCSELITGVTKKERDQLRRTLGKDWQQVLRHNREIFWTGVLGELDIEVIFALPYHPWSKGIVERFYRTFEDHCAKTFCTYCGNNPHNRPECLPDVRADVENVPTMDDARKRIAEMIELYHGTAHSGLEGATPQSVWATADSLRKAADKQLLALMQSRGVYRVGGNGVSFRIAGKTVGFGAGSAALRRFVGRDVFITLDPSDCSCCYAHTPDRDNRIYIGRLQANEPVAAGTAIDEFRRAIKEVNRRRKLFTRAARESPKRMRTAAQEVAALKRRQLAELRKTGTDDARPAPNIVPVRTGFEAVSKPVHTRVESPPPSEYDAIDFDDLDLAGHDYFDTGIDDEDDYADLNLDDISLGLCDDRHDQEDIYAGVDAMEFGLDDLAD